MVACAVCGEENPARARFCLNCGTPLATATGGRETRKVVTVVFSDLAGSTGRGSPARRWSWPPRPTTWRSAPTRS
jgi:hypothetical protein